MNSNRSKVFQFGVTILVFWGLPIPTCAQQQPSEATPQQVSKPVAAQWYRLARGQELKASAVSVPEPKVDDSYSVIYAGRMLGYFRYPEVQQLDTNVCAPIDPAHADATAVEAERFYEAMQLADTGSVGTRLRLASGDDFAPFLLSRQMWSGGKLDEKDEYSAYKGGWKKNEWIAEHDLAAYHLILRGRGEPIPFDNVGCFMRLMHLDAVVPGQYEFYFGPTGLQDLAHYLMTDRVHLPPTRMLGVNLYLQTKLLASAASQAAAPMGSNDKQPKLALSGSAAKVQITIPKTPLPWMRSVEMRNVVPVTDQSCIVDIADLMQVFHLKNPSELQAKNAPLICSTSVRTPPVPLAFNKSKTGDYAGVIMGSQVLAYDVDYAVVVVRTIIDPPGQTSQQLVAWEPFTVVPPFFGYNAANKSVSYDERPWVRKDRIEARTAGEPDQPGVPVAVFGVVDPALMQSVGRYNAVWLENDNRDHTDDHHETDVQVGDPAEALKQAIEYCYATRECTDDTRIVVLAQMPPQTAFAMVGSFRSPGLQKNIDLVISQADQARATGNRSTVRLPGGNALEFEDPVVVTPNATASSLHANDRKENIENRDRISVQVQRAIVTNGSLARVVRNQSVIPNDDVIQTDWFPSPVDSMTKGPGATLLLNYLQHEVWDGKPAVSDTKLEGLGPASNEDWETGLRQLALKRMERYCHSDAAMVQLRDIFYVPLFKNTPLSPDGFEAVMDAIFWKGDYIRCMSVPGSTITSALQRSKDLQQTQYYGLLADFSLDQDWSLATLGTNPAQADPASQFRLIAGKVIDPKRLYGLAVTDFLGSGDTGYPGFQNAEPPPDTPWSRTELVTVADAMRLNEDPRARVDVRPRWAKDSLDTLDRAGSLPASQAPQPNSALAKWLAAAFPFNSSGFAIDKGNSLELAVQDRPMWSIELYKSDFSYSMTAHSGLERSVAHDFPGVSAVDLTATNSSSISGDYLLRVMRDKGRHEWYGQSALNYGYKKTRQATKTVPPNCANSFSVTAGCGDPYVRNQSSNYFYSEGGYAYRFRSRSDPYGMKILIPAAIQTQLLPLLALPEGLSGPPGSPAAVIPSTPTRYWEFRPGFRWDFSYPKPPNWSLGSGGGAGGNAGSGASGSQLASGGNGGGGKGGKGGGGQSVSNGQNGGTGGGGAGGSQTQTFDSFFEFGYEIGRVTGPKALVFSDPNQWMTSAANTHVGGPCLGEVQGTMTIVPVQDIMNCFNAATAIPPTGITSPLLSSVQPGRTHFQDGVYVNYHFDIPIPIPPKGYTIFSNVEFISDLRSDYYFGSSGDTPIDTHFLFDAKESFSIPLFMLFGGKVSLAPSVEMIFYTNKINFNVYKSYTTSVSLSYSFEKRSGLSFWKALGYPNPVPTLPTIPSR